MSSTAGIWSTGFRAAVGRRAQSVFSSCWVEDCVEGNPTVRKQPPFSVRYFEFVAVFVEVLTTYLRNTQAAYLSVCVCVCVCVVTLASPPVVFLHLT